MFQYLRRIFHFRQMDFEFALWQMIYLLVKPQQVYRNFAYRKVSSNIMLSCTTLLFFLLLYFRLVYATSLNCGYPVLFKIFFLLETWRRPSFFRNSLLEISFGFFFSCLSLRKWMSSFLLNLLNVTSVLLSPNNKLVGNPASICRNVCFRLAAESVVHFVSLIIVQETKAQFARDDPAFLVLLAAWLVISSVRSHQIQSSLDCFKY